MEYVIIALIIGMILTFLVKSGEGVKSDNKDYIIRSLVDKNHNVSIILEKVKDSIGESFIIPQGVTTIGANAFLGLAQLKNVTIHEKVKVIGTNSFKGCTGITILNTGESVEVINDNAFEDCTGLKIVQIGCRVREISPNAFKNCKSIDRIMIDGYTPSNIYTSTFEDSIKSNCKVFVPKGTKELFQKSPGWNKFTSIDEIG